MAFPNDLFQLKKLRGEKKVQSEKGNHCKKKNHIKYLYSGQVVSYKQLKTKFFIRKV